MQIRSLVLVSALSAVSVASATVSDNFEGNLSGWTGQSGGPHQGVIVDDPLNAGNHVLSFTGLNAGGDVFSTATETVAAGALFQLSFDYLGMPGQGTPDDFGGFIGISSGLAGSHTWLGGTQPAALSAYGIDIVDDGAWHSYVFTGIGGYPHQYGGVFDTLHIMIEDFSGSGGVAGDAYFDNVKLETVPEPASMSVLALGVTALIKRRKRA